MLGKATERVRAPWPLVGRAEVVDRSLAALDGHVRTVVLSGESGVGKSRVAAAVGDAFAARGGTVLRAGATSIMATVPLGALLPLFPADRAQLAAAASEPAALLDRAMTALAERGPEPRLLVLDDLGLLDPLSTTLVAQLVAVDAVRLVATLRSGDPLPDAILSTWSADRAARFELAPLDVDTTARLLADVLGAPVAHRSVVELHQSSAGNPLYLRELVVGAVESQRLVPQSGVWHLSGDPIGSPALRDLILARISQLGPGERDVVDRLAVCGELASRHLRADGARAALGRLEAAGVVSVGPRLEVRLAHPQYTAVVSASLSRLHTADLLVEQATILEADSPTAADSLRAVVWRLNAGVEADPEILVNAALLAQQAGDHPTVERLTSAALAVDGDRPDVLLMRGGARMRLGRNDDALADLARARTLADDGPLAHGIASATAMAHALVHDGIRDALSVVHGAEEDFGHVPAVEIARAQIELWDNRVHDALCVVDLVSQSLGDSPAERAIVASAAAQPLAAVGRDAEALAAAQAGLDFARATQSSPVPGHTVADALHTLAVVHLHAGRVDDARACATSALVQAIGSDDEIVSRSIEFLLGRIALEGGQLDTAARWFRDTMSGALTKGPVSLYLPALATLAICLIQSGDLDGARRELDSAPAGVDLGPGGVVARAWLSALAGDRSTPRTTLRAAAAAVHATGHEFLAGVYLMTLLRLGDAEAAASDLAQMAVQSPSGLLAVQAAHARAEADADADALGAAGEEWALRGAHLYAAEAFASAARISRSGGDGRTATAWQHRSDDEAARCEAPDTPLLRFAEQLSPLTPREREIAGLAAAGTSSKDIAATLFLSTRTVDNHLQSVYGKLGISGRHELPRR